jgi:hypothetical protein
MRLRPAKHNPTLPAIPKNKKHILQLIRYEIPEYLSVKQPESLDSK